MCQLNETIEKSTDADIESPVPVLFRIYVEDEKCQYESELLSRYLLECTEQLTRRYITCMKDIILSKNLSKLSSQGKPEILGIAEYMNIGPDAIKSLKSICLFANGYIYNTTANKYELAAQCYKGSVAACAGGEDRKFMRIANRLMHECWAHVCVERGHLSLAEAHFGIAKKDCKKITEAMDSAVLHTWERVPAAEDNPKVIDSINQIKTKTIRGIPPTITQ